MIAIILDGDSPKPAGVVIGMLHGGFRGSWVKPPSRYWLNMTFSRFGNYAAPTESMERQFAIRHHNAKKISLGDPVTWRNQPASLSQPPSSNQNRREGADSNLASTKEKTPETFNLTGRIIRLGSTPMARGGYSSVWRGSLVSATSDDPLQVLFSIHSSWRVPVLTTDAVGRPQGASCFVYGGVNSQTETPQGNVI
jgi:hypothetical protein